MARKASTDDSGAPAKTAQDRIVDEARKRFNRCRDWESTARSRFLRDVKFVNGDSYNMWQWPDEVQKLRGVGTADERPMLTVNKTAQHVYQILNDARQNKSSIVIKPTGGGATYKSAQTFEGVVRHIEYISNAQTAYQHGLKFAVEGGIGYWRVVTDYAGPDSFDQEIFIRKIKDPLTVYLDPDINETDGSDARFAIVFDNMPKDAFELAHPEHKDLVDGTLGETPDGEWVGEDHIRVAEYFRMVPGKKDQLVAYLDPMTGQMTAVRGSDIDRKLLKSVIDIPSTKVREIVENKVEWFLLAGDRVLEQRDWPGRYIPIVRCVGLETVIDGKLDRKGHVRALLDPQRMYNYNGSAFVEFGALQSKIPYVGAAAAIEGLETYWETANTVNHSILPYNHQDDEGNPIPPPQRQAPPMSAPVYQQGMLNAAEDMRLVSGQYQADMGAPGNERSGVAIQQRQRQGDNATYHFIDNQALAIRFTGKILIDLIPRIYDTERVIKIMGEDGTENEVTIDPAKPDQMQPGAQAPQAFRQEKRGRDAVETIFNPNVGRYEVEADIGPGFATRRQEAFNAFTQIAAQNPELMSIIGDLMFMNADFPGADAIAERLRRMVPAQATGDGPPPEVQALQGQLQGLQQLLETASDEITSLKEKVAEKTSGHMIGAAKLGIEAYDAESRRINVLRDALAADPEGTLALIRQVVSESLHTPGPSALAGGAEEEEEASEAPMMSEPDPQQPEPVL